MVWPPRAQQLLVVRRRRQDSGPDTGTPLPALLPLETPTTHTMEGRWKGDGLESGQMQSHTDV